MNDHHQPPHPENKRFSKRSTHNPLTHVSTDQGSKDAHDSWSRNTYLNSAILACALIVICATGSSAANTRSETTDIIPTGGTATSTILAPSEPSASTEQSIESSTKQTGRYAGIDQSAQVQNGLHKVDSIKFISRNKPTKSTATRESGDRIVYEKIKKNELSKATPTIQNFVASIQGKPYIIVTNICGSYGALQDVAHQHCAAVDIPILTLPDPLGAKHAFEQHGLTCYSHVNYSNTIVNIGTKGSHLHCEDKYFVAQIRAAHTVMSDIRLPSYYEPWKVAIAKEIATKAVSHGLTPKIAVAVAMQETGITPVGRIGDGGCSYGVYQWNRCARGTVPANVIDAWMDETATNKKMFKGDEMRAVVAWNAPMLAKQGFQTETKYYKAVSKRIAEITP